MRRLLAIALLAFIAAGCGGSGGSDDEDAVREAVELFFAQKEPRGCDAQTERFLKNSEDEADPAAARRQCRKDESGRPSSALEQLGFVPTRGAAVSEEAVDGSTASAKARLQGGDLDGQVIDVSLLEQGGDWKIDRLDGLEIDAALRQKVDRAFDTYLKGALRGDVPAERLDATVACVLEGIRRAVPNERLAMRYEGQLPPDSLRAAVEQAAAPCKGGRTVAGTGYEVTVPRGWKTVKPSPTSGAFKPDRELLGPEGAVVVVGTASDVSDGFKLEQYISGSRIGRKARSLGTVEPITLGGVEAISLTIPDVTSDGTKLRHRQILALRNRTPYFVVFTTVRRHFEDEVRSFDAILATWRWK